MPLSRLLAAVSRNPRNKKKWLSSFPARHQSFPAGVTQLGKLKIFHTSHCIRIGEGKLLSLNSTQFHLDWILPQISGRHRYRRRYLCLLLSHQCPTGSNLCQLQIYSLNLSEGTFREMRLLPGTSVGAVLASPFWFGLELELFFSDKLFFRSGSGSGLGCIKVKGSSAASSPARGPRYSFTWTGEISPASLSLQDLPWLYTGQ